MTKKQKYNKALHDKNVAWQRVSVSGVAEMKAWQKMRAMFRQAKAVGWHAIKASQAWEAWKVWKATSLKAQDDIKIACQVSEKTSQIGIDANVKLNQYRTWLR